LLLTGTIRQKHLDGLCRQWNRVRHCFDYNVLAAAQKDGLDYLLFPVLYDHELQINIAGRTLDYASALA
jgi:hypothetical protein